MLMMNKLSNEPIYTLSEGIKIYDGTTEYSRYEYKNKIKYLKSFISKKLFSKLQPSTLTAQGIMSNISFDEKYIIDLLSEPTDNILMIGCNYGEKYNILYKPPSLVKTSGRGRKPKPKVKSRRKVQGNGKYFSSQITFLISHPDLLDSQKPDTISNHAYYKIKLFRNGVFQVPGIRDPSMQDLVKPIKVLREYLAYNFAEDVQVMQFTAVMRNYKACLLNKYYHVNLEKLEEIILKEKSNFNYNNFINFMLRNYSSKCSEMIKILLGNYNPLNIAEMTYNTDRCFCLIIKFYRPSLFDPNKKTTVKLLKKGKINFDGGNSQQEIEELYAWLEYIYTKYHDQILFDIRNIVNEYDKDSSDCENDSLYDSSESESEINEEDNLEKTDTQTDTTERKTNLRDPGDIIMKALRRPITKLKPVIKIPPKKYSSKNIEDA